MDEYTDLQIVAEYQKRCRLGLACRCTYCEKLTSECNCRYKKRPGAFKQVGQEIGMRYNHEFKK